MERLRAVLTESCRDAAVALTAGEEFSFLLQDLFSVFQGLFFFGCFFFFLYVYERDSSEFESIKKFWLVFVRGANGDVSHLQPSVLIVISYP